MNSFFILNYFIIIIYRMNVIDFCNKQGFLWQPLHFEMKLNEHGELKKTKPTVYKSTDNTYILPKSDDQDDVWKARQKYINCTEYIAIKTNDNYVVVDVDTDTKNTHIEELLTKSPYVLSSTRKLPHIFIKDIGEVRTTKLYDMDLGNADNSFKYNHKNGFGEGLYNTQWSWCRKDEIVLNGHLDVPEFDLTIFNKDILIKAIQQQKLIEKEKKATQLKIKKKLISSNVLDADVEKVLSCIDKECHYDDYFKLACFFHKHLDLEKFIKWLSVDNSKYIESETRTLWESLKYEKDAINLGTLHYMAKTMNPEEYEKLFSKTHRLMLAVFNDFKVAELIHHLYQNEFVYLNINKGSCWYYFKNHRWVVDENALTLSKYLTVKLVELYEKAKKTYENVMIQEFFDKFINKISMLSFQKTFISESQILFQVPMKWFESLDENKYLIGFDNGVYDLQNKIFRDGKPEDLITKTTGYDYTDEINEKIKKEVENFFSECLPEESKEFILKLSAYCLSGNRYLEWLVFLIGIGRNGKGVYKILITKTLGEYGYEPNVSMLTTTLKSSSSATPDKAKSKGVRCMICEEPEDDNDTSLKVGFLKELSGGNKIQARELFKSSIEFMPQFQVFLLMNNPVKLNSYEDAIVARLKNIEFPYKFVENPTLPHEKKRNSTLKENFENNKEYHQQFFLILLDYYYKYIDGSKTIEVPANVKKFTDEYLAESNVVKKFICENYEITNNPDDKVKYSDVYNSFKVENKNMDKTKFSNQLKINGFKKVENLRYKGVMGVYIEGIKRKEELLSELDEPE